MSDSAPEDRRFSFGICGSTGPDPRYNPGDVLREPTAQAIVLLLNEEPLTKSELARRMVERAVSQGRPAPSLDDLNGALARVVALRAAEQRDDGRWQITFPLLTRGDQEELFAGLAPYAASLARDVLAERAAIDAALDQAVWERPRPEIRMAVVGCMGLDWLALARLERRGLVHPGIEYPDGGRFTILGSETTGDGHHPTKLYCSSHSAQGDKYLFTGFGDNDGPRHGIPDTLWRLRLTGSAPDGVLDALGRLVRTQISGLIDTAGAALATPNGQGAAGQLLSALGYITGGQDGQPSQRQIQLFRVEHWPAIRAALAVVAGVISSWIGANYQEVVHAVRGTSPARNGVDPTTFFVELWHDVFGVANCLMAEEGWLFHPPPPRPGEARYMTWCSEVALADRFREWLLEGA